MQFCPTCGTPLAENAEHSCSAPASMSPRNGAVAIMPLGIPRTALTAHVAGALAYAAGPFTGIAFLALQPYRSDPDVRFHAWQSIFFSLAWIAFWIPWSTFTSTLLTGMVMNGPGFATNSSLPFFAFLITAINRLLQLAGFSFWAFLLYKAFNRQRFEIPVIGKVAAAQARQE